MVTISDMGSREQGKGSHRLYSRLVGNGGCFVCRWERNDFSFSILHPLFLRCNFGMGMQAALSWWFSLASSDTVAIMDCNGQQHDSLPGSQRGVTQSNRTWPRLLTACLPGPQKSGSWEASSSLASQGQDTSQGENPMSLSLNPVGYQTTQWQREGH